VSFRLAGHQRSLQSSSVIHEDGIVLSLSDMPTAQQRECLEVFPRDMYWCSDLLEL
jgi:hypothetical protein